MKRITFFLVALFVLALQANAQRTYALLAGVSNYNDKEVNLANTTKDVKEMQTVLKNQGAVITVLTSKYATPANILEKLEKIVKVATPKDKIMFFFSGHGTAGSLVGYGIRCLTYKTLVKKLVEAKTDKIFCFVDACQSGSVKNDAGTDYSWGQANGNKVTFVMASRADEYSWENQWVGNGYFTQAMLKGIRGKADVNGDKKITVAELYKYIYTDVTQRTKNHKNPQHPQLIGPKSHFDEVLATW